MDHPPGPDEFARLAAAAEELAVALGELAAAVGVVAAIARDLAPRPPDQPEPAGHELPDLARVYASGLIWRKPPGPWSWVRAQRRSADAAYLRSRYAAYDRALTRPDEAPADTPAPPIEDDSADPLRSPTAYPHWRTSSDLIRESIIERARWDSWDRARDQLDTRDRLATDHPTDDGPAAGDRPAG